MAVANTLADYITATITAVKSFKSTGPWGICYNTFYGSNRLQFHGNTVILVIMVHHLGNCHGMVVNYFGKKLYNIGPWCKLKYRSNLPWNFNLKM